MEFNKVYIYGLMENNTIFYIGKTTTPKIRLTFHKNLYNNTSLKMKILDHFVDKELYWIDKLLNEGYNLTNKEHLIHSEDWEIGDIVFTNIKNSYKVKDITTNKIYESLYILGKEIGLDTGAIKLRLSKPKKYPEFSKYILI
jgi:hypothetical protein